MKRGRIKLISIVTPCFNEAENIYECYEAVREVTRPLEVKGRYTFEHIFIDNASSDSTQEEILKIQKADKRVKYYRNNRNVGSINNIWLGLKIAKGDLVIPLIPADLQDPPELIVEFIENWELGYLVVQGVAKKRDESIFMRSLRKLFYFIIAKLSTTYLPSGANEFCALDRKVVEVVLETDDLKPYIRGLVHLVGCETKYIEYHKKARTKGVSKESFQSYFDISLNALVSTSILFPRFLLLVGIITSLSSTIVGIYIAFTSFIDDGVSGLFQTENLIWGNFIFLGLQILFLGIICEYIISIHTQVRPRPKSFFLENQ
jgi:polyisoprenyl-phosphate glycosyltransferase